MGASAPAAFSSVELRESLFTPCECSDRTQVRSDGGPNERVKISAHFQMTLGAVRSDSTAGRTEHLCCRLNDFPAAVGCHSWNVWFAHSGGSKRRNTWWPGLQLTCTAVSPLWDYIDLQERVSRFILLSLFTLGSFVGIFPLFLTQSKRSLGNTFQRHTRPISNVIVAAFPLICWFGPEQGGWWKGTETAENGKGKKTPLVWTKWSELEMGIALHHVKTKQKNLICNVKCHCNFDFIKRRFTNRVCKGRK